LLSLPGETKEKGPSTSIRSSMEAIVIRPEDYSIATIKAYIIGTFTCSY